MKQLLSLSIPKNANVRGPKTLFPKPFSSFYNSTRNPFLFQRKSFVTGAKVPTFNNFNQYSSPLNTKLLFTAKPNNYFKILQRGVKSYKEYSGNSFLYYLMVNKYSLDLYLEPKLPEQYEEIEELDDSEKDAFLTFFKRDKKYKEEGKDFYIIRFPETFHEGELLDVKWCVDVGNPVKQHQLLFTLEFDKEYELEINSPVSGLFKSKNFFRLTLTDRFFISRAFH